jgi:hypothetical protein
MEPIDSTGGETMADHRTDHRSPAEIRAARAVTRDGRAPAVWKRAARTLAGMAPSDAALGGLLRAKGWRPVWGRYLLAQRAGRVTALPRRPTRS